MEPIKIKVKNKQLDGSTEVSEVTFTDDNEVESENSVEPGPNPGGGGDFPPIDDYSSGVYSVNISDDWTKQLPFKPDRDYGFELINVNTDLSREEVIEILNNAFPDAQVDDYFYLLNSNEQFSVVCRRFDGDDWAFGFYDGDVMISAIDTRIEGGSTGGEWINTSVIYQYLEENSPYISSYDLDENIFKKLESLIYTCGKRADLVPSSSQLFLHRISFDCFERNSQGYPRTIKMFIDIYTVFESSFDLISICDFKNQLLNKVISVLLDVNEATELVPAVILHIDTAYGTTDKIITIQSHELNGTYGTIYFDDISNFEDEVYSMD